MEDFSFINSIFHIDRYLLDIVKSYGHWTYVILMTIIFSETGLIITPFLPGDALLFATGAVAAQTQGGLSLPWLLMGLSLAAILGNQLNYALGYLLSLKLDCFTGQLINQKHLAKAHNFYEHYGKRAIILARFVPIIRTFIPFIAGISRMNGIKFSCYNTVGGLLWVNSLLLLGYFLGSVTWVNNHFSWVIYGIIGGSLAPTIISILSAPKTAAKSS